jgi:nicotinate-nucleotide adenylyltransferase
MNVAIFGGTFDPVHKAHLAIARAARERFPLDRVLLIPAANPPHKQNRSPESWQYRFRMVEIACQAEEGLEPSDIEAGTVKSYSIDTIERVRKSLRPADRLFFLIGADAFAEIGTWHRASDVVSAVDFIVVTRPGHVYATPEGARVHVLDTVHSEVSSSAIRDKLARCERPQELPRAVFEYIREHGLYGYGSACANART